MKTTVATLAAISCVIKQMGKLIIPDPIHGDLKLSVFPFEHTGEYIKLPEPFSLWNDSLNEILKRIPLAPGANQHYITIDSKFFTKTEYLRREGIHADGNFCVDPSFREETWGGTVPSWADMEPEATAAGILIPKADNSHVKMDWVLPYPIMIPVGDYISDTKGGILSVATQVGCQGWQGTFEGNYKSAGDAEHLKEQFTDDKKVLFEKDTLYFMTSNTPHETLLINKGDRRTLIRITLNHEYPNHLILNK